MSTMTNEWQSSEHALAYLQRADKLPHRTEGEATLLSLIPKDATRILDLGTGDGRLLALVKIDRPEAAAVALDFSPAMLAAARQRFDQDPTIEVVTHDLDQPLPDLGMFDAIVSSFVIHHLVDLRKKALYAEVFRMLKPGGVFCNLEHVASVNRRRHEQFLHAIGYTLETEDPSNKLASVEVQLQWLRAAGFAEVDCYWKWLEMALLAGVRP